MKMALSIINNLWLFVQQRDLFPDVNGVRKIQYFRYEPLDLTLLDRFWRFFSWLSREALFLQNLSRLLRSR
jgi:hypothetical protein